MELRRTYFWSCRTELGTANPGWVDAWKLCVHLRSSLRPDRQRQDSLVDSHCAAGQSHPRDRTRDTALLLYPSSRLAFGELGARGNRELCVLGSIERSRAHPGESVQHL